MAIGFFSMMLFLDKVDNKWIFVPVVLIASFLPDIGRGFRLARGRTIFKFTRVFSSLDGMFKSFTVCVLIAFLFAYYFPILAFPFFLGYAINLIADSWSVEGIRPFWPFAYELKGKVGGVVEESIFIVFLLFDVMALILLVV